MRAAMALAALGRGGRDLEQAGEIAVMHADRGRQRRVVLLQHEQPGFRLDRADDLGQARPQRRVGSRASPCAARDEAADVLQRDLVHRLVDRLVVEVAGA